MDINVQVGPQVSADGAKPVARGSKTGAVCVIGANGPYSEPAQRANIMVATTAVAGVAPGTALSTTPPFAIWNPPSSGKNIAILRVVLGYVSGTLGAGSLVAASVASQATVPTTGTELTPACTNIGMPRGVGRVFQGSTLAGTPAILRPLFPLGAFVGGAGAPVSCSDEIGGSIVIPPGSVLAIQGVAGAGTSPLVIIAVEFEEIAI